MLVAPGEAVTFDGSASAAGDRPIARYSWDFQDGTTATGVRRCMRSSAPDTMS